MRIRHRVPTIFNLSMVDVLCCALGCVILLWLLNQREAHDQARAAEQTGHQLNQSQLSLDSVERELKVVRQSLRTSQQQERHLGAQVQQQRRHAEQLEQQAQVARLEAAATRQALQQALGQTTVLSATVQLLQSQQALANQTQTLLEKALAEKSAQLAAAQVRAEQLAGNLQTLQSKAALLEQQAVQAARQADVGREQWFRATAKVQLLERDASQRLQTMRTTDKKQADLLGEKQQLELLLALRNDELTETKSALAGLKGQTQLLAGQVQQLKASADQRFAGVALTGRRVVFLLDMSGSMGKLDYNKPDATKWPLVCATLGKIMASLPDLEKYQVLLFSDEVSYPLGHDGKWLDYRPQLSARVTVEVLQRTRPGGATNMAAAFREAFRYRAAGLDTIYLLSDGLPNVGAGLPPRADQLNERDRTALCSKYLRDALKTWNAPKANLPRVRVNAIGFYYDSPDVGAFLWVLAREHEGSFVGMSQP